MNKVSAKEPDPHQELFENFLGRERLRRADEELPDVSSTKPPGTGRIEQVFLLSEASRNELLKYEQIVGSALHEEGVDTGFSEEVSLGVVTGPFEPCFPSAKRAMQMAANYWKEEALPARSRVVSFHHPLVADAHLVVSYRRQRSWWKFWSG